MIFSIAQSTKIAFGSCYDSRFKNRDIFKYVLDDKPDYFVWLGDFAYISKSKQINYKELIKNPIRNFPTLAFDILIKVKG